MTRVGTPPPRRNRLSARAYRKLVFVLEKYITIITKSLLLSYLLDELLLNYYF